MTVNDPPNKALLGSQSERRFWRRFIAFDYVMSITCRQLTADAAYVRLMGLCISLILNIEWRSAIVHRCSIGEGIPIPSYSIIVKCLWWMLMLPEIRNKETQVRHPLKYPSFLRDNHSTLQVLHVTIHCHRSISTLKRSLTYVRFLIRCHCISICSPPYPCWCLVQFVSKQTRSMSLML